MCLYVHVECSYVVNAYTCLTWCGGGGEGRFFTIVQYIIIKCCTVVILERNTYKYIKWRVPNCVEQMARMCTLFVDPPCLKLIVSAKLSQAQKARF